MAPNVSTACLSNLLVPYHKRSRTSVLQTGPKQLFVSDRRYKEEGVPRMLTKILLLSIIFTINKFDLANRIEHEFGNHTL